MDEGTERIQEPYVQETNWGQMILDINNETHTIGLSFTQKLLEPAEESSDDLKEISGNWFVEGDVLITPTSGDIIHDFDRVQQILMQTNKDHREKGSDGVDVQAQIINSLDSLFEIDVSGLRLPTDNS
jgi:hypothetical protein